MTKRISAFLLAVILLFSFCGCNLIDKFIERKNSTEDPTEPLETEDPNYPVTVAGMKITSAPEKVAVISPALAEYISDMGLLDRVCGLGDHSDFSDEAKALPKIGSVLLPDLDAMKELAPQYILTFSQFDENSLIAVQQLNIDVLVFPVPKTFDELRSLYKELALFFLGSVEGPSFGENYCEEYDLLSNSVFYSGANDKAVAAYLRGMDNIMITSDSMAGEILAECFDNAALDAVEYTYNLENIKDFQPDVIFVGGELRVKDLELSDYYKKKTAVKNDKVYLADLDAVMLCSKRSFQIIRDMMSTVYDDYALGTPLEVAYPSIYQS